MADDTIDARISPTVGIMQTGSDGTAHVAICVACGHELGAAADGWKPHAIRREVPLKDAGGPAYDTGSEGVVLRHFYCGGCATLLDTETATPGDPVLDDRLGVR